MRYALPTVLLLLSMAGCSNEYSSVPEPSGDWVAANDPSWLPAPSQVVTPAPPLSRRWPRMARR